MSKLKRNAILTGLVIAMLSLSIPACSVFGGDGTYKTTASGLQYRIIKDNKQRKALVGDYMVAYLTFKTDKDSLLTSSRTINDNKPFEIPVTKAQFKGDFTEGYLFVGTGDSAEFKVSNDSIFKGQQMPPFAKPGGFIHVYIQVVSVMTKQEYDANKKAEADKQVLIDENLIKQYIKDKGLTNVQRTESGLYYVITKKGDGAPVVDGKTVSVNYTGKLLSGKTFDSSVDPAFHHVSPLEVQVGAHRVITGWDEGLKLFNVGGQGSLIIPSGLAYGSQARGADIPANSVLVFDMDIVGLK